MPEQPTANCMGERCGLWTVNKWKQIVDTVQLVARYVCMPDSLRLGLASAPLTRGWDGETIICPMGKPAVAIVQDYLRVFVAAERFLFPPLQLALMMERSRWLQSIWGFRQV